MNNEIKGKDLHVGMTVGDMLITDQEYIPNKGRFVTVKCKVCGMERKVPPTRLLLKQNRYHHACEWLTRGETKLKHFAVGTTHGDFTITGHSTNETGKPVLNLHCNVCGTDTTQELYRTDIGAIFKHSPKFCRQDRTLNIGDVVGDYKVLELIPGKIGYPVKVTVECLICGNVKTISKQAFMTTRSATDHKNCPTARANYFEVGKVYGDMLIQDVFYKGTSRAYKVKCQVCGHERETLGRMLGTGVGFTHERSCPAVAKYDLYIDKIIGDHKVLEIIDHYPLDPHKGTTIRTQCQICGREKTMAVFDFYKGNTKLHISCGKGERMSDSKFHKVYYDMYSRIANTSARSYDRYGGRGIKNQWKSFLDFKDDMYESYLRACEKYPGKRITLERVDIDKDYCKENCTWCPVEDQGDNTSKTIYFRATCPDGSIVVDRNLDRFYNQHNLMSYRHNPEKKGYTITRITKEEYEKYRTRVPDYLIDHCFKIINDLYLQKVTTDNPIVNIPVLTVSSTSNCHVNPEMEHMLCLEDNPYNLDIKLNTDNKQHVFIVSTAVSE